ncbi:MAG: hypothetical protein K6U87_06110 [Firmicutes bacterium]|nr:hypothetical protein [Bacillota bacterium]
MRAVKAAGRRALVPRDVSVRRPGGGWEFVVWDSQLGVEVGVFPTRDEAEAFAAWYEDPAQDEVVAGRSPGEIRAAWEVARPAWTAHGGAHEAREQRKAPGRCPSARDGRS